MKLPELLESCKQAAGARGIVLFDNKDAEVARVGEVGGLTTQGGQIVLPSDATCVGLRDVADKPIGWLLLVSGDDQAYLNEWTVQIATAMTSQPPAKTLRQLINEGWDPDMPEGSCLPGGVGRFNADSDAD